MAYPGEFILAAIPGLSLATGVEYTTLGGNTINPSLEDREWLNRMYFALSPSSRILGNAACELVARLENSAGWNDLLTSGSTAGRNHAEENLLKQLAGQNNSAQATLMGIFVSLEPCHGRYPRHNCMGFFEDANGSTFRAHYDGQPSRDITGNFLPSTARRHTPIFILENQLLPGEKSALGTLKGYSQKNRDAILQQVLFDIPSEYNREFRMELARNKQSNQQGAPPVPSVSVSQPAAGGPSGSRSMGESGGRSRHQPAKKTKSSRGKRRFLKFWRLFRR